MESMAGAKQLDLKEAYTDFRESNPTVRIKDAASRLGVSEGELLATTVGDTAVRLRPEFKQILNDLSGLGKVMALTRNEQIVHERKGVYENPQTDLPHGMALFVNPDIDLRIFLKKWAHAFAATVENPRGTLQSLQFFGSDGQAFHKIYLTDASDLGAYEALVEKYQADEQSPQMEVEDKEPAKPDIPDSEIDVEGFRDGWSKLQDTHDFFPLLKKFKLGRRQALRLASPDFVTAVPADSFKALLEEARDRKVPIMVFVGNDGLIQIHTGEINNVLEARGWYNVMDEDFNLHIDQQKVGSAYIVRKPTEDGTVTSLELFNLDGDEIALFFGKRKPGIPEREDWRDLVKELERDLAS